MDPLMRAMRKLGADIEALSRARPGSVLPILAESSERDTIVKALRLRELAPDNRRPLFLFEASFTSPAAYFTELSASIARDYELLRAGVAEEGVPLPPFPTELPRSPLHALPGAVITMHRAAELLGEQFEGAVFALVPRQVVDATRFRQSLRSLQEARLSERVRLLVFTPEDGPLADSLGPEAARLHLD